jgi:hypothetical protein
MLSGLSSPSHCSGIQPSRPGSMNTPLCYGKAALYTPPCRLPLGRPLYNDLSCWAIHHAQGEAYVRSELMNRTSCKCRYMFSFMEAWRGSHQIVASESWVGMWQCSARRWGSNPCMWLMGGNQAAKSCHAHPEAHATLMNHSMNKSPVCLAPITKC